MLKFINCFRESYILDTLQCSGYISDCLVSLTYGYFSWLKYFAKAQKQYSLTNFDTLGYRSSHRSYSMKKGVLENLAEFTGKHLCQSLFLNKVSGLRPATLLKERLWNSCFPVNFTNFWRTALYRTPLNDSLFFINVEETTTTGIAASWPRYCHGCYPGSFVRLFRIGHARVFYRLAN